MMATGWPAGTRSSSGVNRRPAAGTMPSPEKEFPEECVHQGEDGGVGADAEGDREHGNRGERGIAAEQACGEAEVGGQAIECGPAPGFARGFLDERDVAESAAGGGGIALLGGF